MWIQKEMLDKRFDEPNPCPTIWMHYLYVFFGLEIDFTGKQ